jgi:hypothetical protein
MATIGYRQDGYEKVTGSDPSPPSSFGVDAVRALSRPWSGGQALCRLGYSSSRVARQQNGSVLYTRAAATRCE